MVLSKWLAYLMYDHHRGSHGMNEAAVLVAWNRNLFFPVEHRLKYAEKDGKGSAKHGTVFAFEPRIASVLSASIVLPVHSTLSLVLQACG